MKTSKKTFYLFLVSLFVVMLHACNNDKEEVNLGVPELLYGKWTGEDRRVQSLTFIIRKDGTCYYKRASYIEEEGIWSYDIEKRQITTTIEELGEGPIIYIINLLTEEELVVKKAAYDSYVYYNRSPYN